MNRIILWISFIAVIGLIVWAIVAGVKNSGETGTLRIPVGEGEWVRGATTSKAVLVEYSDFQCPACAAYEPLLQKLLSEFPNDLTLVYRHFPLITIHRNADLAAGASEVAGHHGKFWEMHDLLFEKQTEWANSSDAAKLFADYAASIGIVEEDFIGEITSTEVRQKINAAYRGGIQSGVKATPTFFLNGVRIEPKTEDQFRELIKNAISTTTVSQ